MSGTRIALIVSTLLFVGGLIGWLAGGGAAFGFAALVGVLGLAITFIFSGGPRGMYGPVSARARRRSEPPHRIQTP